MSAVPTVITPSKLLQERFGTNCADLARRIECDRTMVVLIIKGERRPSWALAHRMAEVLGINIAELSLWLDETEAALAKE